MNKKLVTYSLTGLMAGGTFISLFVIQNLRAQNQSIPLGTVSSSHDGHSMGGVNGMEMDAPSKSNADEHSKHGGMQGVEKTQAKLTQSGIIALGKPIPLKIDIADRQGKAIAQFDTFQEKLMHLIVVSDNLQFFDHIHPAHKGNGRFEVSATFPQPGSYTLFSDYKPTGQKEAVSALKAQAPGSSPSAPAIDLRQAKFFGETKATLSFGQPTIKAGEEVALNFSLQQATNNQPITDLQPYLGERGHLVILKKSAPLTRTDYIHAHALKDTPAGQITFMTKFPQPGKYKLWGQFNRNGKIVIADFWIDAL
jgi:hypothetical protein